jgi:2-phosphosulfolactate phosphatase
MKPSVIIDCFPSAVANYREGYALVTVDVIRATTVAVTAVASGRRCFTADSLDSARQIAASLAHPLLVGELGGDLPDDFDMNNSPADLALRTDLDRPMVLLSSSGTKLMSEAARCEGPTYVACFRNHLAVARHLAGRHRRVAIIGAGSREEFREEDQMCCAWIAEELVRSGYQAEDQPTAEIIERWSGLPPSACYESNSVAYLRRSGQLRDLDFILDHVHDLDMVFTISRDEIVVDPAHRPLEVAEAA